MHKRDSRLLIASGNTLPTLAKEIVWRGNHVHPTRIARESASELTIQIPRIHMTDRRPDSFKHSRVQNLTEQMVRYGMVYETSPKPYGSPGSGPGVLGGQSRGMTEDEARIIIAAIPCGSS